jgi:hypothetical protein
MEKGKCSISGLGGTIYWVPENYMKKHFFKLTQFKKAIEKDGGIIISKQTTNVSETLVAYHCKNCKKIVLDY